MGVEQPENYGAIDEKPQKLAEDEVGHDGIMGYHRVILFACFLCLVVVGEGYDVGVINGAALRIREDLKLTTWHISLVVAMTPLFFMPGSLAGGALADAFGRRAALMVCCVFLVLGPLGMAMSVSFANLLVARALVGVGIGMGYVIVSMYVAEVAPTHIRGRLIAMNEVFLNIGILSGYLMNWFLLGTQNDWRWMLAYGSVLPFILLLMLSLPQVHESPRWLFMNGRTEEAEKVLVFFVGREEADRSLKAMASQASNNDSDDFVTWKEFFAQGRSDRQVRRMLLAGITVGVGVTMCGYIPMITYSSIVLSTSMSDEAAFRGTAVMGAFKLLVVIGVITVLESAGRRLMLLISSVVCGFSCVWLAYAFATGAGPMMLIIGFALFMAGFSLGLGPLACVYISEVFTTKWRGKGMAASFFLSRLVGVASAVVFPTLIDGIGVSNCFWVMATLNIAVFALIWTFVYETSGTALEEVDKLALSPRAGQKLPATAYGPC